MPDEHRAQVIEIWKTVVEVQRHFNDIGMRIRSLFVTILLALFASIGFLLDKSLNLQIWIVKIQFAVLVPLFGIFGAYLFYFIDRYWYHRLLVGAVKKAYPGVPGTTRSRVFGEAPVGESLALL